MILVSIIMPVYNGEKYLEKSISSVLNQTYKNWELIIINDGSTDNSLNIINKFISKDNRIKLINQDNSGVVAARTNGINMAKGKYITFLDCDDWFFENRLQNLVKIINDKNCDLLYTSYMEIKNNVEYNKCNSHDKTLYNYSKSETIDNFLFEEPVVTLWRCVMKTELVKKIKFRDLKFCEDLFFILDYCSLIRNSVYISDSSYAYRRNDDSVTMNLKKKKYLNDFANIPVFMCGYLKINKLNDSKYKQKLAQEYAYSAVRIKRITDMNEFIKIVSNKNYIDNISYARFCSNDLLKGFIYLILKFKLYYIFIFIKNELKN